MTRGLFLFLGLFTACVHSADAPPKVNWHSDLGQAAADAREKKCPLLLLLENPEQTWSRQLLAAFDDEAVRRSAQTLIAVRLNSAAQRQLVERFAVQIIPDLRIFTTDGRQADHVSGQLSAAELAKFLDAAQKAEPAANAPTLSMFYSGNDLDGLLQLEQQNKWPDAQGFARLMELASGRNGETQIEAQRLLRKWAPVLSAPLSGELAQKALKRRLVAYEILKSLEAPLDAYDPWQGSADEALIAKLKPWAVKVAAERAANPRPASLSAAQKEQMESDLAILGGDDPARAETARQRLIALGKPLVPILRERARAIVAQSPGLAVRYDELRFRLLLNGEALRRQPGVMQRLVRGGAASRAGELERLLHSGAPDLDDLSREAACDRDGLVRVTALRNAGRVIDEPDTLYREALQDGDAAVRTAAIQALALWHCPENDAVLETYFKTERDLERLLESIRALSASQTRMARALLIGMLKDARPPVRAASAEQLGTFQPQKPIDPKAFLDLQSLLQDADASVVARAVGALAKFEDVSVIRELGDAAGKPADAALAVANALGQPFLRAAPESDLILRRLARHEAAPVRAAALLSLARSGGASGDDIVRGLTDLNNAVRGAALEALRDDADATRLSAVFKQFGKKLLGDAEERIALQAALTAVYFGDERAAMPVLSASVVHPDPALRKMAYPAFSRMRGDNVLELLEPFRVRVDKHELSPRADEWAALLDALSTDPSRKSADWKHDSERMNVFFMLLPRLPEDAHAAWFAALYRYFLDVPAAQSDSDPRRTALASILEAKLAAWPPGAPREIIELLWLRVAALDAKKRAPYLTDPRLEIRRMASAQRIRSGDLLPEEWVLSLAQDASAEMRRLALVEALPDLERRLIDDPLRYDLVAGVHVFHETAPPHLDQRAKLPADILEKLAKDDDESVRICAAYFLACEGNARGLEILRRNWRSQTTLDGRCRAAELFVGAAAAHWDDSLTPLIKPVLQQEEDESADALRGIHALIRDLPGEQIRRLREALISKSLDQK